MTVVMSIPSTPKPQDATHHDGRHWYHSNGRYVWCNEWMICHWGDTNPLNHIFKLDEGRDNVQATG
ncbi:hypothetical protein D3C85_15640 [compost metagenome]